jgi:uncharacterized protein
MCQQAGSDEYTVLNENRQTTLATRVRIAGTSQSRRRGLLDFEKLHDDAGLWITPCEAIHTFGMRMPVDVIFLDQEYRVTKLHYQLRPARIAVCLHAHSVLEVAVGATSRSATTVGDRLRFLRARHNPGEILRLAGHYPSGE